MKKFFKEFKDFALRGNVMDLAVGVIIGAAFQSIVNSLVNDVISPLIGLFADTNFDNLTWIIKPASATSEGVIIKYGAFLTAVINFIIMAFIIFMLVKLINRLSALGKPEAAPTQTPTTKKCPYCCSEIAIEATRCPKCTSELTLAVSKEK